MSTPRNESGHTRKHSVVLRGGPLDGKIATAPIGVRGIVVPVMIPGKPGVGQVTYRPTDEREDGRQVFTAQSVCGAAT